MSSVESNSSSSSSEVSREKIEVGNSEPRRSTDAAVRVDKVPASASKNPKKRGRRCQRGKKKKEQNKTVEQPPYHCDTYEEVVQKLGSSMEGLSDEEVTKRLAQHGDNVLKGEGGVCGVTRSASKFLIVLFFFRSILLFYCCDTLLMA